MKRELIAAVAHDINRAYCLSIGDDSQPTWADAPEWQKRSALAGVDMHLANPDATPEQSHESWLEQKIAEGWVYGEVKDVENKQHPCCVPYDELAPEQKCKDYLFRAVVHALKDIPDAEEALAEYMKSQPAAAASAGTAVAPIPAGSGCRLVRYIGRRDLWLDRIYQTGLTFVQGQVRSVPPDIAKKLLNHIDLFEEVRDVPAMGMVPAAPAEDDTQYQLEQAARKRAEQDKTQLEMDVIDQVNSMDDKDSLVEFAITRCQLKLTKNMKTETMREKIVDHIKQFGVL